MSKKYHFIGIGGIGMGGLASLLMDKGYEVSGSDLRANEMTERLKNRGAEIAIGHSRKNVGKADHVVFSSAIPSDNPELQEAQKRKIPALQRAKLLAELMDGYVGITVAGAHGKTTTSSMIAHLLVEADLYPTTAIGGIVIGSCPHAHIGRGEFFVAEVDESDGSFLHFNPNYSVITNIDFEHVDYYGNWEKILDTFAQFIGKTSEEGCILAYGEDERLMALVKESGKTFKTYGFSPDHNICSQNIIFDGMKTRFNCFVDGKDLGQVTLNVPGNHNVANALACIGIGLSLGIDFELICASLNSYEGVQRRFQLKERVDDVWVIDDYAHHPTEISTTIETAQLFKRSIRKPDDAKNSRLITVFQPHRFTRVEGLFKEFARSFFHSDYVIITDIYAASEQPIEGITSQRLGEEINSSGNIPVKYLPKEKIIDYLLDFVKPNDVVLTLGAGDITRISDGFTEALKSQSTVID